MVYFMLTWERSQVRLRERPSRSKCAARGAEHSSGGVLCSRVA